tara:strand:+ start:309 stop:677 length:369 start_codon:yes stop_codon:yes gene_type:complete
MVIYLSESKTSLVKKLRDLGIVPPKGTKIEDLKHMAKYWKGPRGYLFRLALPASRRPGSPAELLTDSVIHWVPDSDFAVMIAESKLVFIMGRSLEPPKDSVILDVPKDFNDRWGVSDTDGNK